MPKYPENTRIRLKPRQRAIVDAIQLHLARLTKQTANESDAIRFALEYTIEGLGLEIEEE